MATPNEVIEKLCQIIDLNEFAIQEVDNQWVLIEKDVSAKLKKVFISPVTNPNCAFKLDGKNPNQISFYINRSAKLVNQGCDAIIFTFLENDYYILFCEMKSEFPKEKDYKSQFANALCFVDYLELMLKRHYNYDFQGFKKQFILFYYSKENTPMQNFGAKHRAVSIDNEYKVRPFPQNTINNNHVSLQELLRK